ncbi:hypothetical protein Tco_0011715 [Tanacetum coccineum]
MMYSWHLHRLFCADMDIFAFIHTQDPTKVKIVEQEQNEDEPPLLETTIGHTVPLLLIMPACAESELEASVDMLFDKGGSGNQTEQGDSAGGGQGANIQLANESADTVVEDVAHVQPKLQRKRKTVVVDAGESSHPPKRLREDHGTPGGTCVELPQTGVPNPDEATSKEMQGSLERAPTKNYTGFAIGERQLPIESIIASGSTDVMVEPQ